MAKDVIINLKLNDKEVSAKIIGADKLVNQLRESARKTSDVFAKWAVITTGFNQALSLGKQVFSVASQMVQPFLEFERGMANVNSILRLSGREFNDLSEDTLRLQKELGLTSKELTGALYQIVSAGVPAGDAIKFLEISSKASIAGLTDTQTAADGLTTVVNAFKYELGETEKVADIMFNTVKLGKTTFEELATSLSEVAPIASSTGVSFEEVSGAIATLTKQGVSTGTAVTQIRASIIALNDILGDGWAETMSYQEAVSLLNEKAGGSPKVLKEMIGRVEGVNAVLGLTGKNLKTATDDLNSMSDATGEMSSAFAINSNTMERKISKLQESFNVLLIKSVGAIEPLLTGAIEAGSRLVDNIDKIGSALSKLGEKVDPDLLKLLKILGTRGLSEFGKGSQIPVDELIKVNQEYNTILDLGFIKWVSWKDVATESLRQTAEGLAKGRKEMEDFFQKTNLVMGNFKKIETVPQTVNEIKNEIKKLEEGLGDLIPGTQAYINQLAQIDKWKSKISNEKKTTGKGNEKIDFFDVDLMKGEEEKLIEMFMAEEERSMRERERLIELNQLKNDLFEEEKTRREEEAFLNEMIYYSREELLNKQIELEQKAFNIENQMMTAGTAAELDKFRKEKSIVDQRIQNIKAEAKAREESTKQMVLAGMQQYDASVSLGKQLNQIANESIRRIIGEAVATQIAKVIATVPWPFNMIVAPLAGLAVQALLEKFIPKFETGGMIVGKRHSSGGTIVNAEGGEFIVNRESTRSNIELLEAINSGRSIPLLGMGSNRDVINAIIGLGKRLEKMNLVAKLSPREFDEGYSDYLIKKSYTG